MGRGRPRGGVPTEVDRTWHQCTVDACRAHGVRLLGFYVASLHGLTPIPEPIPEPMSEPIPEPMSEPIPERLPEPMPEPLTAAS